MSDLPSSSITPTTTTTSNASKFACWHEELRLFEATRRQKCSSKLDSCKLFWKSHQNLLQVGLDESQRAHRLVLGLSQAQKVLATSLRTKSHVRKKTNHKQSEETTKQKSGFLDSLQSSTDTIKSAFLESSRRLAAVDQRIQKLLQQSQDGISQLETEGKAALHVMEETMNRTTQAWGT
jgi:hypothetical protein